MIRLLYLRWHRRQLRIALDRLHQAVADALEAERIFTADLQRVEADLAVEEMDRKWRVRL